MKNFSKIIVPVLLFTSFNLFAQFQPQLVGTAQEDVYQQTNGTWAKTKGGVKNADVTGSKYLFDNTKGATTVVLKNKSKFELATVDFNLDDKQLESKMANDSVFVIDTKTVDYIVRNNEKYIFEDKEIYKEIFNNDKIKIYKKFKIRIKEKTNALTKELEGRSYVQSSDYSYLNNGVIEPLKLSKKNILKLVTDKQDAIKEYADSKKLDFSEEKDLVEILKHYNTL